MAAHPKGNPNLVKLIEQLRTASRQHKAPIWRAVAEKLEGPARNWAEVNISRIARFAKEGETILIPGKLLGTGTISFGVTVGAYSLSAQARKKIEEAGGHAMSIKELATAIPDGSGVRIMG